MALNPSLQWRATPTPPLYLSTQETSWDFLCRFPILPPHTLFHNSPSLLLFNILILIYFSKYFTIIISTFIIFNYHLFLLHLHIYFLPLQKYYISYYFYLLIFLLHIVFIFHFSNIYFLYFLLLFFSLFSITFSFFLFIFLLHFLVLFFNPYTPAFFLGPPPPPPPHSPGLTGPSGEGMKPAPHLQPTTQLGDLHVCKCKRSICSFGFKIDQLNPKSKQSLSNFSTNTCKK